MMNGLDQESSLEIFHGVPGKFFPFVRTIFRKRPDYIHVDWLHQYYSRRAHWMTWLQFPLFVSELMIVKLFTRTKLVWTLHNIQPHDQAYFGPYIWARRIFAKETKWIRVFSKRTVIHASQELRVTSDKFKVIPEGSYVDYYPNDISKTNSRKILGLEPTDFVLLSFGSIRPYKGIEKLICAFLKHKKEFWKLVIAGPARDREYRRKIEAYSGHPDIIIHPEIIPIVQVQNYMNAADLVVLSFEKIENSGSAILAMSFKKPVLAPKKGVLPDRLSSQKFLLYNTDEEIFEHLNGIDRETLELIGMKNYYDLNDYEWTDFSAAFI